VERLAAIVAAGLHGGILLAHLYGETGRLWAGPSWSCGDRDKDRKMAGGLVRLSGASVASASARSMCASALVMARSATRPDSSIRPNP
jgi:hypothetical protein